MPKLRDVAHTLRSKNAGPFAITYDVIFKDEAQFWRAKDSGAFTPRVLAERLKCPAEAIRVVFYPPAKAVKATVPRLHSSGAFQDTDIFGCQQHGPLLDLEVP